VTFESVPDDEPALAFTDAAFALTVTVPITLSGPIAPEPNTHVPDEQLWPAAHTTPQPPQFVLLVFVLVSQPSLAIALQSAKPALQLATRHVPVAHPGVPLGIEHTLPHAPQLAGFVCVLTSQPLAALMSQSAKPILQLATRHVPAAHAGAPLGVEHTLPHAPQLDAFVCVLTSQPLAGFRSQSAKPALQLATAHIPAAHAGVPFAIAQVLPHEPQLAAFVCVFTSQPFAGFPSQSAKPALQLAIPQPPAVHTPVALAGAHAIPHPPQCASEVCVLTSQPLLALPSQFAKPALQLAIPHAPIAHAPVALAGAHAIPHPPQCASDVCVLVSQPLLALPSQLPKPALQLAIPHAPIAHAPVALAGAHAVPHIPQLLVSVCRSTQVIIAPAPQMVLGATQSTRQAPATQNCPAGQTVPHAPQLFASVCVLTSQPLAALMSQSAKPMLQLAIPHTPMAHAPVALAGAQPIPQPPQCVRLVCVSVSQPFIEFESQSPRPLLHIPTVHTPITHAPVAPAGAQFVPHPPQLAVSVCVLTQVIIAPIPQRTCGAMQSSWHAPATHTCVPGHIVPHAPQFVRSVCGSTQLSPQRSWPAGQPTPVSTLLSAASGRASIALSCAPSIAASCDDASPASPPPPTTGDSEHAALIVAASSNSIPFVLTMRPPCWARARPGFPFSVYRPEPQRHKIMSALQKRPQRKQTREPVRGFTDDPRAGSARRRSSGISAARCDESGVPVGTGVPVDSGVMVDSATDAAREASEHAEAMDSASGASTSADGSTPPDSASANDGAAHAVSGSATDASTSGDAAVRDARAARQARSVSLFAAAR
jgi:hypothetical protein